MPSRILNLLLFGLWSCSNCGSLERGTSLLCPSCAGKLQKFIKPSLANFATNDGSVIPHLALIEWNPGQSDLLSKYIRSLKGMDQELEWLMIAELVLKAHEKSIAKDSKYLNLKQAFFLPVPAHEGGLDHAGLFALGLATLTNRPQLGGLIRSNSSSSQKKKRKIDREAQSFSLNKSSTSAQVFNTDFIANCQLILIDDVLTTGGTLRSLVQCLLGLGITPQQLGIITLASRARSCGF